MPFIKDLEMVDFEKQLFNLTIFNGQPETFRMFDGSIDQNFQLHGTCYLGISKSKPKFVGTQPMLQWTPYYIKGKFVHGNLEGPVRIVTTNNNIICRSITSRVNNNHFCSYCWTAW